MKTEINLLPVHLRNKKKNGSSTKKSWLGFALPALLILFFLIYSALALMNQNQLERIKQVEKVIGDQEDFKIPYEDLKTKNELLAYRNQLVKVLNPEKAIPLEVLIGVQNAISLNMELIDYQFNQDELTLVGNTENQEDILKFRERLMALGLFENISIDTIVKETNQENPGANLFEGSLNRNGWNFILKIEVAGVDGS